MLAITSFARSSLNSQVNGVYLSREALASNFAIYDFLGQAYYNASLKACMAAAILGNQNCLSGYLGYYANAYNLKYFKVFTAGQNKTYTNLTKCFPYNLTGEEDLLCLEAD